MSVSAARKPYFEEGPLALVIGCGDMGMGAARALGMHHPLLMLDIDAGRLEAAVETLRNEGYRASAWACDIIDPEQTAALEAMLRGGPGVRILAHVAGVGVNVGSWQKMMAVDLLGPHLIANAVEQHMVRGGAAVFVGSLAGYLVRPDARLIELLDQPLAPDFFEALVAHLGEEPDLWVTYNYAKFGLIRLAEMKAMQWGPREVRALSLSPGMIDTRLGRADGANIPSSDGSGIIPREKKVAEIPLARQGTILEISKALAFLVSDAASFVNGIDLLVDGGQIASLRSRGIVAR